MSNVEMWDKWEVGVKDKSRDFREAHGNTHSPIMASATKLLDAALPVPFLTYQFVDFIVQVADPMLFQTGWGMSIENCEQKQQQKNFEKVAPQRLW